MEVLGDRRSERTFVARRPDAQTLSNLLWAAWGFNRPGRRTAPSSHNRQEIDLYVAMEQGLYLYDAVANLLRLVLGDDIRRQTGVPIQSFVGSAPIEIILVCNRSKIKGKTDEELLAATYANTGFISENIYLFCASFGLSTVIRAMVDRPALAQIMQLHDDQMITLVQTVGYDA